MFSEKIEQLIVLLEKQEIDATNGVVSSQLYAELLSAYIYKGDYSNARFLWKRIPVLIKNGNIELEKIYTIYKQLSGNDMAGFFKTINYEWSTNVAELMFELKEKIHQQTISLIGLAYSSIFEDYLCGIMNQSPEALSEMCKSLGWQIQDGPYPRLVLPTKPVLTKVSVATSESQLATLTDFVSFLEN